MPIRDRQSLFRTADDTLHRDGAGLQQLLLIYLAIITTLSLVASALTVVLSGRIENTGGLSNFGLRSVLSTAQTVLPLVQSAVMVGLQLGYTRAGCALRLPCHDFHVFRIFHFPDAAGIGGFSGADHPADELRFRHVRADRAG